MLAALVLMQDDIVEEVRQLDNLKSNLLELIEEVNIETQLIKKQLQQRNKYKR